MVDWANVGNFFARTWYIWVAIFLIIVVYLYSKLDSYTKYKLSKIFTKSRVIVLLMIIGWIIWAKFGAENVVKDANRWVPLILLGYFTAINYVGKLRYDTQQFVSPNFHGSFSKNPDYVNGFYIFYIGSFNSGGISWDYANKIVVVREETVELFLHGALSIAEVSKVSKYSLDDDVRLHIESNTFLKGASEEIYYGWFDSIDRVDYSFQQLKELQARKEDPMHIYNLLKKELKVSNPKVSTLFWLYKNQCKATGKQTEQYDSTVDAVEKGVEHRKRVRDAYVSKSDDAPKYTGSEEDY